MTLTLYGASRSRASIVRWYLAEKGIPYRWQLLDLAAGEQKQPEFLAINPFGKVPALVDESWSDADGQPLRLFESGAILLHLAEHHGREFEGEAGPLRRSLTAQWVFYANATFGPALMAAATGKPEQLQAQLAVLNGLLPASGSLLAAFNSSGATAGERSADESGTVESPAAQSNTWSAADCAVEAYLAYLPLFCAQLDLSPYPQVQARIAAVRSRPAYLEATNPGT